MESRGRVLITGGSRGIGRAVVLATVAQGYKVTFTYKDNVQAAQEVQKEAELAGFEAPDSIRCDLSNDRDVRLLCEFLDSRHPWYGFVHNAGFSYDSLLAQVDVDKAKNLMETGVWSMVRMLKTILPGMSRARMGRIIFISSIAASNAWQGNAIYSAVKAAGEAICRGCMAEYRSRGVTANSIAPGYIQTDLMAKYDKPAGHRELVGAPAHVASMVIHLLSNQAEYVNGQTLVIDGGRIRGITTHV